MKNILTEGWSEAKSVLTEGVEGHRKAVLETLLENQRRYLMENAPAGATTAANIASLNKVVLPIIRRVYPNTIAHNLVGVVPMAGPVGQINTLRVKYGETFGSPNPVTAGTEALSPYDIARFYSGNGNSTAPAAAATSVLEGTAGKRITTEIVKTTVEAKTRRLSATWTFESQQDAQSQYGVDLEAETLSAVAAEISAEIDQELLLSLRRLAGTPTSVYNQANTSGVGNFVGDEHAALGILINRHANLIGQRTRRGAGNWVVVSTAALTVLQSARTTAFARAVEGDFDAPVNTQFAGTLNGSIKVYTDTYAADNEVILVGLKKSEQEAAAYYCPYIPLMSTPVIWDPQTLMPVVGFVERYGYVALDDTSSNFGNSKDFLSPIGVSNLTFF